MKENNCHYRGETISFNRHIDTDEISLYLCVCRMEDKHRIIHCLRLVNSVSVKSHTDWVAVWGSCQDGVLERRGVE